MARKDQYYDILIHHTELVICVDRMSASRRDYVLNLLDRYAFDVQRAKRQAQFRIDRYLVKDGETVDMAQVIGRHIGIDALHERYKRTIPHYPQSIDPDHICERAKAFAAYLRQHRDDIIAELTAYETYEVAHDEFERTLDLFENIDENEAYYRRQIGNVLTLLPRNQPLYAFSCFSLVLAFMAREVYTVVPSAMTFFPRLVEVLNIRSFFPNVYAPCDRQETIAYCAQMRYDITLDCWRSKVDVVIFTGSPENAKAVRRSFDEHVLFIANGAGHNPLVVTPKADLEAAAEAAVKLQLYNQGQDCANPSSILVHDDVYEAFTQRVFERLKHIRVGPYSDPETTVGPITKQKDLERVANILLTDHQWISDRTPGVIHTATQIVEPTVILKPLCEGGNYTEQLSPIFYIQRYERDDALAAYFDRQRYWDNAMYVTVYGHSDYVESLVHYTMPSGRRLHDESTIIRNTHLHAPGVERGTQPYGGYGHGASSLHIHGEQYAKPTLPQRDIYEQLVAPSITLEQVKKMVRRASPPLNIEER